MSLGVPWPQPNLMAGYHLADANDFSGNGKTLTKTANVSYVLGKFGNGANFPGSADSMFRAGDYGIGNADPVTILCWFKPMAQPATDTNMCVLNLNTANPGKYLDIRYLNSGGSYFTDIEVYTNAYAYVRFPGQLATGSQHFLAITYDGATAMAGMLDGKYGISAVVDATGALGQGFIIGCTYSGYYYMNGVVDEVEILKEVWSQAKLRHWYAWSIGKF